MSILYCSFDQICDVLSKYDSWVLIQVTGSNQGIGYEIVRQLCRKFDGKVILSGIQQPDGKGSPAC